MNRKKIFFDVLYKDNFKFALHTYAEVKYNDHALQYIYNMYF